VQACLDFQIVSTWGILLYIGQQHHYVKECIACGLLYNPLIPLPFYVHYLSKFSRAHVLGISLCVGTMADGSHSSYLRFEVFMDYKDYHFLECDATVSDRNLLTVWRNILCCICRLFFTRLHSITCKKAVMFIVLLHLLCQSYVCFAVCELLVIVNM
jgi:hypothetical protein